MLSKYLCVVLLSMATTIAVSEDKGTYTQAVKNFRDQPAAAQFFKNSYAYVIFPTIGKGGIGIGGAFGKGRAYRGGSHVGNVTMAQLSIGWQLGGQAYSEIIFFQNADVFNSFSDGDFQFGAYASAVALTTGRKLRQRLKARPPASG